MDRVKTIRECSFVLPTEKSDVICRVKVDAMGETEQDAILVFDYAKLVRTDSDVRYNDAGKNYLYCRRQYAMTAPNIQRKAIPNWFSGLIWRKAHFPLRI